MNSTLGNLHVRKSMKPKDSKDNRSKTESLKWILVAAIFLSGFFIDYYFVGQSLAVRAIEWVVLLLLALGVVSQTQKGKQWWVFAKQSQIELRKVIWPTRQEVVQTTLVVIAIVLVVGMALWGVDAIVMWLIGLLTGQRG